MAKPPSSLDELSSRFGPHLNYTPPGGWAGESGKPAEKLVKTHCCFCGQQCGIQLKVRDNRVTGFEPWEDFPFNRGMLCPKGVKRYLQGNHPDRLLDPLMRTEQGFRAATVGRGARFHGAAAARAPGEVRQGCRGGLRRRLAHHREGVPAGQVRARGAGHPAHRLQRPALHGVGRHGLQAALGVDRAPNPWSDISEAQVLMVIGANIGECAPITTDYIWRAATTAASSSSPIRASRRSRATPTCTCRCGRAPTWRC